MVCFVIVFLAHINIEGDLLPEPSTCKKMRHQQKLMMICPLVTQIVPRLLPCLFSSFVCDLPLTIICLFAADFSQRLKRNKLLPMPMFLEMMVQRIPMSKLFLELFFIFWYVPRFLALRFSKARGNLPRSLIFKLPQNQSGVLILLSATSYTIFDVVGGFSSWAMASSDRDESEEDVALAKGVA